MTLDVVRLNIERFRRLLKEATDPNKRSTIEKLLKEEEAKPREVSSAKLGNSRAQK